jgi:hypothetical protein
MSIALLEQLALLAIIVKVGMSLRHETTHKRAEIAAKIVGTEPAKHDKKIRRKLGGYYDDPIVNKDRGDW